MTHLSNLGDSGVMVDSPSPENSNDMSSSGILVEEPMDAYSSPTHRRIVKASAPTPTASNKQSGEEADSVVEGSDPDTIISSSNDEELLQESIEHSRQKRLQQLAADQRLKRSSKQAQGRTLPKKNTAQANPFSRFLSAFSVDTKYPHHKRAYDESESGEEEPPSKHPRTEDYVDVGDESDVDSSNDAKSFLSDIAETLRDNISYVAATVVASLALMTVLRKRAY